MRAIKMNKWLAWATAMLGLALATCGPAPNRTAKIGLVAPFEGRYRAMGYDVVPAVRLALQEFARWPQRPDIVVELVAYDDMGDPDYAAVQASRLLADPDISIVIGHWLDNTTMRALPIYEKAGIPVVIFSDSTSPAGASILNLSPSRLMLDAAITNLSQPPNHIDFRLTQAEGLERSYRASVNQSQMGYMFASGAIAPDQLAALATGSDKQIWTRNRLEEFAKEYEAISLGSPPGMLSIRAYEATWLAIAYILSTKISGHELLPFPTSTIQFDNDGRRMDSPVYLYRIRDGVITIVGTSQ